MKINDYYDVLNKTCIFNHLERDKLIIMLKHIKYKICKIKKDCLLFRENEKCNDISILLEGEVIIQKMTMDNKTIIIDKLSHGDILASQTPFAEYNHYMADTYTLKECVVMYISKEQLINICLNDREVLEKILSHICTKNQKLLNKISYLTSGSIRNSINKFLYENYINSGCREINLYMSKTTLSEYLGIERTSLSRELKKMKNEGLIDFNRNSIYILNLESLVV